MKKSATPNPSYISKYQLGVFLLVHFLFIALPSFGQGHENAIGGFLYIMYSLIFLGLITSPIFCFTYFIYGKRLAKNFAFASALLFTFIGFRIYKTGALMVNNTYEITGLVILLINIVALILTLFVYFSIENKKEKLYK